MLGAWPLTQPCRALRFDGAASDSGHHSRFKQKKDALNGASFLLYMAGGLRSDICHYRIILVVFVLAAVALAYFLFRGDKLNTLDPLDHLVAQLILGTKP